MARLRRERTGVGYNTRQLSDLTMDELIDKILEEENPVKLAALENEFERRSEQDAINRESETEENKMETKIEYVTVYKYRENPEKDRQITSLRSQICALEEKIKEQEQSKHKKNKKNKIVKIISIIFLAIAAFYMGAASRTGEIENMKAEYEYEIDELNNTIANNKTKTNEKIKKLEEDLKAADELYQRYLVKVNEQAGQIAQLEQKKEQAIKAQQQSSNTTKATNSSNSNNSSKKQSSSNGNWSQAKENVTTNQPTKAKVYWTSGGKSYHSRRSCPTLSRSKNVSYGSNCPKSDPCNVCN